MFSMRNLGILALAAVANAKHYVNPSEWNGIKMSYVENADRNTPNMTTPENCMVDIANDVIKDLKEIGDEFRKYDQATIKNEICVKFSIIDIGADTFILKNVSPGHQQDILDAYLDGVCETLGKDNMTTYDNCKAQLATIPYIGDGYWDYEHTYFDNSQKTYPAHIKIWKSMNDDDSTNWLIAKAHNTVEVAPDTIILTDSHCSSDWFSSSCSTTQRIVDHVHNLTPLDVEMLDTFFNSILVRKELEALHIQDKVNMTDLMWPADYCA